MFSGAQMAMWGSALLLLTLVPAGSGFTNFFGADQSTTTTQASPTLATSESRSSFAKLMDLAAGSKSNLDFYRKMRKRWTQSSEPTSASSTKPQLNNRNSRYYPSARSNEGRKREAVHQNQRQDRTDRRRTGDYRQRTSEPDAAAAEIEITLNRPRRREVIPRPSPANKKANILLIMNDNAPSKLASSRSDGYDYYYDDKFYLDDYGELPDGEPVIVIDVEELNNQVRADKSPIPLYDDIMDSFDSFFDFGGSSKRKNNNRPEIYHDRHEFTGPVSTKREPSLTDYYGAIKRKEYDDKRDGDIFYEDTDYNYSTFHIPDTKEYTFGDVTENTHMKNTHSKSSNTRLNANPKNHVLNNFHKSKIIMLKSGKYKISGDSIQKIENLRIDQPRIVRSNNGRPTVIGRTRKSNRGKKPSSPHTGSKNYKSTEKASGSRKKNERDSHHQATKGKPYSYEISQDHYSEYHPSKEDYKPSHKNKHHDPYSGHVDSKQPSDVVLEYDTKGMKDIHGITLLISGKKKKEDHDHYSSHRSFSTSGYPTQHEYFDPSEYIESSGPQLSSTIDRQQPKQAMRSTPQLYYRKPVQNSRPKDNYRRLSQRQGTYSQPTVSDQPRQQRPVSSAAQRYPIHSASAASHHTPKISDFSRDVELNKKELLTIPSLVVAEQDFASLGLWSGESASHRSESQPQTRFESRRVPGQQRSDRRQAHRSRSANITPGRQIPRPPDNRYYRK